MSNTVAVKLFDYAALPADLADDARKIADRIRSRMQTSYIETGLDLINMKAKLGHGRFGPWIAAEFAISERTAENYMNAAAFLEGKSETLSVLPPTVIFALAAPSAPAELVNEVVAAANNGAVLLVSEIREKLTEAKDAVRRAKTEAKKTPEQREKERRKLALRETLDKKRDAEIKEREAEQERNASVVASFLVDHLNHEGVVKLFELLGGADWRSVVSLLSDFRAGGRVVRDTSKFRTPPTPLRIPTSQEAVAFERQDAIKSVRGTLRAACHGFECFPHALLRAIKCKAWTEVVTPMGNAYRNASMVEWITAPEPKGLGTTVERVRQILTAFEADSKELAAFEAELAREYGRT